MRYLRILSNSIAGGMIAGAYLIVLILQLNPQLPLDPRPLTPLALAVFSYYGAAFAMAAFALIAGGHLLADHVRSPGWLSLRLLGWLAAAAAGAGAALMWLNLRGLGATLDPASAARMSTGALALSASAAFTFALALSSRWLRRRGLAAALLALTLAASVILPLWARGVGAPSPAIERTRDTGLELPPPGPVPRVVMLLFDGASLDFISLAAAEGRLPNFGRILDRGAVMHLATLRPTQPAPVWTALATGKLPYKNGVRFEASYPLAGGAHRIELLPDFCFSQGLVHLGLLVETPHSSAAVRARPLWSILGAQGISTGIVAWPLTFPARPIRGYLISDHLHRSQPLSEPDEMVMYPPALLPAARSAALSPAVAAAFLDPVTTHSEQEQRSMVDPLATDARYEQAAAAMQREIGAQVSAVRYQGLDAAGHYFLRYAVPRAFGDVSEQERQRYGRVLERYYAFADGLVGRALASLGPDDLLLVVSGFGMEPLSVGKRLLERVFGNPELSGSHEAAPDGFLLAYGADVATARLARASVVDVTPTVLYFLGLPVGRDMDGYARTDIFRREFTGERPITFIPSYDW